MTVRVRGRRKTERGATLLEGAIVLPIVIALLFGVIEFSLFFKDSLTVSQVTREGARAGSIDGNDPLIDYYILQAIKKSFTGLDGNILSIVIWNAAGPDNPDVPAACQGDPAGLRGVRSDGSNPAVVSESVIGSCNVYPVSALDQPRTEWTTAGTDMATRASYWPPSKRVVGSNPNLVVRHPVGVPVCVPGSTQPICAGPDYAAVWVKTTHNFITGFFSSGPAIITDSTMIRLEPKNS